MLVTQHLSLYGEKKIGAKVDDANQEEVLRRRDRPASMNEGKSRLRLDSSGLDPVVAGGFFSIFVITPPDDLLFLFTSPFFALK